MGLNTLEIDEKHILCEYKAANPKVKAKHLIEFCSREFKKTPSTTAISRILLEEDKWKAARSETNAKRARGGKWPDLEKLVDTVMVSHLHYNVLILLIV